MTVSLDRQDDFVVSTTPLMDLGIPGQPLPETSEQKLAELVRLQKFVQRITSTLDIEELVPRIVDEVASSLGCVEINLYLRERDESEFVLTGVRGCTLYGKGHRLKKGSGMVRSEERRVGKECRSR